ncbi:MAG: DUF4198 domain-containing protein [Gemmatimonadales bacterium]|nr:MAG: DUF4198 domain-containing protein [Gemmatimonadales bacterium]
MKIGPLVENPNASHAMKRQLKSGTLAMVLVAASAALLAAHDLFIKMDAYHVPPGTAIRVPIINSTFFLSENSITADRVADVSVVVDGHRTELGLDDWDASGDSTFLGMRTGDPGTYVLGVSTNPNDLGMSADDFNLYLASDGVVDVLKQRALEGELDEEAWEQYSKHVKAIFQVGDRTSGGIDVVFGYPAELVPLDNPYEASVGDELSFLVLVDSKPVAGQLVIAGGDGGAGHHEIPEREARSDLDGVVSFEIDHPGRWYLKFIHMVKTEAEDLDYESKWATISFEVR